MTQESDPSGSNQQNDGHSIPVESSEEGGKRLSEELAQYSKEFSEERFWQKIVRYAKVAGKEVIEKALLLYYVSISEHTPLWAKALIWSALGYFINSFDAIPDFTPVAGFADDLGILALVMAAIAKYVSPQAKERADDKVKEWFGSSSSNDDPKQ